MEGGGLVLTKLSLQEALTREAKLPNLGLPIQLPLPESQIPAREVWGWGGMARPHGSSIFPLVLAWV